MKKQGFTIIELLIVIAIIGILVGVAVPYYNDYIYEARLSVLKQNLTAWRNAINQFRADNLRGPMNVVATSAGPPAVSHASPTTSASSELTAGPIQIIDDIPTRRTNVQYIPRLPVLQDPATGADIPVASWTLGGPTAYFYDLNANGEFDIDTEWAFIDGNNDGDYIDATDAKFDTGIMLNALPTVLPPVGGTFVALDYTTITVETADGSKF